MKKKIALLGLETEYGIIREDLENSDPVEESMKLLKSCPQKSVFSKWNYSQENSHLFMRVVKVHSLAQDEEEDEEPDDEDHDSSSSSESEQDHDSYVYY